MILRPVPVWFHGWTTRRRARRVRGGLSVFDFGDVLHFAESGHVLQRIAGFTFLPLFVMGFVEMVLAVGIKQHFGLVGEHA